MKPNRLHSLHIDNSALYSKYQDKRRNEALKRQKQARLQATNLARKLANSNSVEDSNPLPSILTNDYLSNPDPSLNSTTPLEAFDSSSFHFSPADSSPTFATYTDSLSSKKPENEFPSPPGDCHYQGLHDDSAANVLSSPSPLSSSSFPSPSHFPPPPTTPPLSLPSTSYSRQLMIPEWMTDIPEDLGSNWFVMPRPQGRRCLLISSRGWTVSRLQRSGSVLHRFQSPLPDGSQSTVEGGGGGGKGYCILDAVYDNSTLTYYIQDLMCWRGMALYDMSAEYRFFWLASKWAEEGLYDKTYHFFSSSFKSDAYISGAAQTTSAFNIVPLPFNRISTPPPLSPLLSSPTLPPPCATLREAHSLTALPFQRDGLLFVHALSHYEAGQASPLALLWKDDSCASYVLDTDAEAKTLIRQVVVLELREDGTAATGDEVPVVLGQLPRDATDRLLEGGGRGKGRRKGEERKRGGAREMLLEGEEEMRDEEEEEMVVQSKKKTSTQLRRRLLKFEILTERDNGTGITFDSEGKPIGASLRFVEALSFHAMRSRGSADLFSKILFQYLARRALKEKEEGHVNFKMLAADNYMGSNQEEKYKDSNEALDTRMEIPTEPCCCSSNNQYAQITMNGDAFKNNHLESRNTGGRAFKLATLEDLERVIARV
eukprot:CAMPEP_0175043766 /NCGR_PEP_ID=MMETSP0052_2-20121109/3390_1 /TAXON_ID=51329 ORGANISM="Polytomella parva, Strain SAG 63-3" /NCGR_SAMPLE_ID=MMETSP0052_2 /ASSEMBLY_ACC=CAM_ASM_000194 /LENGTH=656 /DNA_ID=CAMNT_0016306903 /DNA_START=98 /DNA_END=2068 /DNA_ORIENTATION=+